MKTTLWLKAALMGVAVLTTGCLTSLGQGTNADAFGTWSVTTQCPTAILRQFVSSPFGDYYPPGGSEEPKDLNGGLGFSGAVSQAPDGSLSMATDAGAVFSGRVTGNIGDNLRLDYINQFGPTDAWFTLDTVTLTNASQLYFDTSAWQQPQRLYRLVQVP